MTVNPASASYSGRRSDRVGPMPINTAGQGPIGAVYAPEALAAGVASASAAARPSPVPEGSGDHLAGHPSRSHRSRTGQRQLTQILDSMTDRDSRILHSMTAHPFLLTAHVQRLHFRDHASDGAAGRVCRRVLARLSDLRAIEHLERRIGGVRAGSASFVWRLGPVGERLLQQASVRQGGPRLRRKEPSLHHLDHCLAIAETHLRLLDAGQDGGGFELLRIQTEPSCWRPFAISGGGHGLLKPDLYAVTASADYEDHWFIEVDRGTESLPTLRRKCAIYEQYRCVGREQQDRGVFPLVLWLLPDERRRQQLKDVIDQAQDLDPALYRLATFTDLTRVVTGGVS